MTGAQFEIRIDGTPRTYRDRKDFAMEAASFLKIPKSAQRCRSSGLKEWRGDGRHPQGRLMPLTMRPAGLSSGIDQDRADYTVFWGARRDHLLLPFFDIRPPALIFRLP
jgi:hypothetical protein